MKDYWIEVLQPARREMLTLIKAELLKKGGEITFYDDIDTPVLFIYKDRNEDYVYSLESIHLDKEYGIIFVASYDEDRQGEWYESEVSTDVLADICYQIFKS